MEWMEFTAVLYLNKDGNDQSTYIGVYTASGMGEW